MANTSDTHYLTVEEVADRLHLSIATVRRRCAVGEWGAEKFGKQWSIPADAVADSTPARKRAKRPADSTKLNYNQAVEHIRSTDISELWIPDVLRYRDFLDDRELLVQAAKTHVERHQYGGAERIMIPKSAITTRPGVLLDIVDRVAFQAVVAFMTPVIDKQIGDTIYSARPANNKRHFLQHGTSRFGRFKKDAKKLAEERGGWVAEIDISSYFEHIIHDILFQELTLIGIGGEPLRALRTMLSKWAVVKGAGLPQGPNASRVLGNFYLAEVDSLMIDAGYTYLRYMDDVRLFADTKPELIVGIRKFETACRQRGLTISSEKTKALSAEDFVKVTASDSEIDDASYFFKAQRFQEARPALKSILTKALKGERLGIRAIRFSAWRLAQLRDGSVVGRILARLEFLSPVASVVAAYLKPFLGRESVRSRLAEFMNDTSRSHSDFLRSWIFACMLESQTIFPEWRRLAERQVQDRNSSVHLRAIAACVLGKCRVARDLQWIKNELKREHDPILIRAYLVALRYGGSLDKATLGEANLNASLERTAQWLRTRQSLPSLVYTDTEIALS